jgi:hypothetical protein
MSRLRLWLRRHGARRSASAGTRLQLCRECGEDFVYPVTWTESGPDAWWLLLRCGGCGSWRDVVASNAAVADFDRVLDEESAEIELAADRLGRESLRAEADALCTALDLDLIGADDFR